MSDFSETAPAHEPSGSTLLSRLRRLFRPPQAPASDLRVAGLRVATDQWPAGLRVLVVDDNPVNRMVASEMLDYFGFQSLLASDGAQAVAIAANNRLDLILMDLQMPVLDGLGATRQIRRSEREQVRSRIPVVAYTSLSGGRLPLSDYGLDDLLEKPCEMEAMRACLLRWCPPQAGIGGPSQAVASIRH